MSSGAAEQAVAMGIFPSIGMVVGVLLVTTVVPMIMRVTTSQIKTVNASLSAFRQRAWQVSKIAATSPLMLELELEDAVIDLGKTLMDAALNGELAYILLPLNERPERDFVAGDAVEFGKLGIEVVTGAPVTGAIAPIKGFIDPGNIKSGQLHLEDFELPGTLEVRYAPVNQRFVIVAGQSFPVGFDPDEYEYDPETRCYHLPDMQPGEQPTY